jgi:parallel beta-helix repeat protein
MESPSSERLEELKLMKTRHLFTCLIAATLLIACNPQVSSSPTLGAVTPGEPSTTPTSRETGFSATDTPEEPEPSKVFVMSDGSGDYNNLELAVKSVPEGSTIVLGEGTFQLEEPLDIDKPLTIEGDGPDRTIIVGEGPRFVARYSGKGLLTLRDIAFRREGEYAAAVMVILSGEVDFSNCRFSNGASGEDSRIGDGLVFLEDSSGTVKNCEFDENYEFGITVLGLAKPKLIDNIIHDNRKGGIAFQIDEDGGLAEGNDLSDNDFEVLGNGNDIRVSGPYGPNLVSNSCSSESFRNISDLGDHSGIVFASRGELPAADKARGNNCAVAWCDTPTGSFLSMNCRGRRDQ